MTIRVWGVYSAHVAGDGEATAVDIDLGPQIDADDKIKNKTPVGVLKTDGADTATIAGTVVTLGWESPPPAGSAFEVHVTLLFDAVAPVVP